MYKKRVKIGLVCASLFCSIVEAHATIKDVHEIIDICTSSERIMKDYALIGMRIVYHNPQKDLEKTISKLDEDMSKLEANPLSKKLHKEEVELQHIWDKLEKQLKQTPNKGNALQLRHHVDDFAKRCELVADDLAQDTGQMAESAIVHIANLDLDVQELAGDYIMKAWDTIGDEEYYDDVKIVKNDYQKEYHLLEDAKGDIVPEKVKKHLKMLDRHFVMFEFMLESHSGRYVPLLIAKKADKIHKETINILNEDEREEEK